MAGTAMQRRYQVTLHRIERLGILLVHIYIYIYIYIKTLTIRPQRPGFDSRHYQKKVVGLERGPLSLVSTTEVLLDRKVAAPV
jgi:hypothetical protein